VEVAFMDVSQLRSIPLFAGVREEHVRELVLAFQHLERPEGTVLFRTGDTPAYFEVLTKGIVTLEESGATKFQLHPVSPIGELGALTGMRRNATATAATDIELLSIRIGDLLGFFERHADIAAPFFRGLLGIVSEKVKRDRRRMSEMRANIIRTQKAMKGMRELILASRETEISQPVFEVLDELIQNNRRANYRATPVATYPARVRTDDGRLIPVIEVSQGFLKLKATGEPLAHDDSFWAGVLVLPQGDILVSGRIIREGADGIVIKLDAMIEEFRCKFDDYTTKLQLLDFVV
jgi:CRP-like cAMP-binding protein